MGGRSQSREAGGSRVLDRNAGGCPGGSCDRRRPDSRWATGRSGGLGTESDCPADFSEEASITQTVSRATCLVSRRRHANAPVAPPTITMVGTAMTSHASPRKRITAPIRPLDVMLRSRMSLIISSPPDVRGFCQALLGATTLWTFSDLERHDHLLPAFLLICGLIFEPAFSSSAFASVFGTVNFM